MHLLRRVSDRKWGEQGSIGHPPTKAEVVQRWGPPKRQISRDSLEIWTYKTNSLSWRGMEVWGIVSVPFLLPVGRKKATLEFYNGQLVRYTVDSGRGWFVGFFISNTTNRHWWFFREDTTYEGYWGSY